MQEHTITAHSRSCETIIVARSFFHAKHIFFTIIFHVFDKNEIFLYVYIFIYYIEWLVIKNYFTTYCLYRFYLYHVSLMYNHNL